MTNSIVIAKDLSQFIRTSEHRGNKQREPVTPVMTDCCLRRSIWLIVFSPKQKGIIGLIGHVRHGKALLARYGTQDTENNSWPKWASAIQKGINGPGTFQSCKSVPDRKGFHGPKRAFYPERAVQTQMGMARKGIIYQSEITIYPKGHYLIERALVARNEDLLRIISMMVSDRRLSM